MTNLKRGVILMNLGSPDSTEVPDVRKYLDEFLTDRRVIDSWLVRNLLVRTVIVPKRAPESAKAYRTIWSKNGSPLVHTTMELAKKLQEQLPEPVSVAMRYGNPDMESAFEALLKKIPEIQEVIAVPLYPHYAMSSYETAVEHAKEIHRKKKYRFRLRIRSSFLSESRLHTCHGRKYAAIYSKGIRSSAF